MESPPPDYPPPHVDASRPSLGFPLGTALLLLVIFSLSGIFSCCYHWDKLRSLRNRRQQFLSSSSDSQHHYDLESDNNHNKSNYNHNNKFNQGQIQKSLPVLMPGDEVPKFIALPCPCQPPISSGNKIHTTGSDHVQLMMPYRFSKPPPPPPLRIAVPLY